VVLVRVVRRAIVRGSVVAGVVEHAHAMNKRISIYLIYSFYLLFAVRSLFQDEPRILTIS
jgi:hypothetical protein